MAKGKIILHDGREFSLSYIPDEPDFRDWKLPVKGGPPRAFPPEIDLRDKLLPPYTQMLGDCAPNAVDGMRWSVDAMQGGSNLMGSRLALYYDARALRGWELSDTGSYIRDNLKVLATIGSIPESMWPYDPTKYTQRPPDPAYTEALEHQTIGYYRLDLNLTAFKACLADGYSFVIGATIYENFLDASDDGMVPMPAGAKLGGHAFVVAGYRDIDQRFICRNSWGDWGDHGDFYPPYAYLTNSGMAADPWTIRSLEEEAEPVPPPDTRPVILAIKRKKLKNKYNIWVQDAHPDARLFIDEALTDAGLVDGERFVLRKELEIGEHFARVENPLGNSSDPYSFQVLV